MCICCVGVLLVRVCVYNNMSLKKSILLFSIMTCCIGGPGDGLCPLPSQLPRFAFTLFAILLQFL